MGITSSNKPLDSTIVVGFIMSVVPDEIGGILYENTSSCCSPKKKLAHCEHN